MGQNIQYDFCPKCGALMRQGVCQSCEFTVNVNPAPNPGINIGGVPNTERNMNKMFGTKHRRYRFSFYPVLKG